LDELQNGDNPIAGVIRQYDLMPQIRDNQEKLLSGLTGAGGGLLNVLGGIFSSILAVFVVISLTVFMLKEGPRWMKIISELQPADKRKHREQIALQMYRTVSGYVTGNLITSFISATVTATALTILGIPYSIPLGVLVGVFGLMPLVGATLGGSIVVLVSLFHSVSSALIMLVIFLIYQEIENDFLQPMIYSKTVKISPLTVLIAALLGISLAGVVGALVAIPTAASIQILIKDFLKSRHSKAASII
jgi:predicted PurR-regulated permease PerM